MAGWFSRKINTLADFKGLKMRIPGLGGKVVAKLGGSVVLTPGGEIFAALERGVIDASEWIGPHDDMKLGLQNTARYYYYPGWHEPGTMLEFGFNKKAYDGAPGRPAAHRRPCRRGEPGARSRGIRGEERDRAGQLKTEFKGKVEILPLPAPVLRDLRKVSTEVVREESEKCPMAKRVYASFTKFQGQVGPWGQISEGAYQQLVAA